MKSARVAAVSHNFGEDHGDGTTTSKVNRFEALFLVRLAEYLVCKGTAPESITILTTYIGQMMFIKQVSKSIR